MKRLSRLVVRFVGWCIAAFAFVLAVVLLVSAAYLVFFDYPEHIRAWMESEASRVLGRPVRIESFSVYLPNSFELIGVSADPRGSGPPWLECNKLKGQLNLSGVFSSRLQLSMLQVDGLVLRIHDYGGGKVDLPGLWRPEAPERRPRTAAPLSIEAERIVVNDAQFLYQNHNLPWRLEAYQVEAAVERAQGGSYQGHLAYDRGELKIKDRPAFEGGISAQLELLSNELRLKGLRAAGPFYEIRAQGAVDFNDEPEGHFVIDVESQVGPAARSLLGWPQLDDGGPLPARIHGNLSVGRGWHLFEGDLDVPMAKFLGASLRDWKGKIYWNRTVLELTEAEGRLANGDSELLLRQPLPVAEHAAQLSMEFQGVSLRALTESVTGEPGYLDSLLLGEVHLSMPPSQPLQASGDFELAGRSPGETTAGQYGLELNAQGVLDEGTVTLGASRFDTGSTTASLSGRYPWSGAADLSVELSSGDLREADRLQQILRGLFHPGETIPLLNLEGSGDVGGTLTGRIPALTFQGRFRGANVRFEEVEFSQVDAQGKLDATHLRLANLHAQQGTSEIDAQVELDLTKPASEWKFDGTLHEWPVSDIDRLMPLPLDVTGALSADGSVVSEGGQYTGQGSFTLKAGSIYGVEFDEVRAETELRGQQAELKSITISRRNAKVSGQLHLDSGAGRLDGSLEGRELPLSVFRREGFELQGVSRGELRLTGTLDEPMLEMTLSAPEVSLGQTSLGRGRLHAQVARGVATGKLTFQDHAFAIEAQSQVRLVPGSPFEGEVRWEGADLGPWVRFFRSGLPPSVRLFSNGEASVKGEWSSLQSTEVDASVENIRAEIGGYRLVSEESVEVRVRNGVVETPGIHLSGEGTQVEIAGKLPLGEGNLDLQANGSVNLEMLQSFYPRVSSSGDVQLSARVTGDWNRPYLSGQADVSSGVLRFRGFPQAIGDIRGRIAFDNRTVRFPNLRATFGGAPVGISGTTLLSGLSPSSFELRVTGQGLRLRYPEGLIATLNGNLQMSGTPQSQILSGRINVQDAQWVREYDLATGILVSQDEEGFEILEDVGEDSALTNLRLDVEIVAPGTFKIRNSRAKIDAEAQLQLRGTFKHPILLGRSEALRGELFLLGQRYDLVSGKVDFIDPASVKPFFDVVAESRVKSYRVELRLTGTPDRFFPELSSDPPLRTVDILRLLAGASERDILIGSEEEEIAGVGVASLLTERLTQEVGRRAERLFGLDRFSIDPFLVGQFANPTARVSIGKEIYRNLSVNYSTNLNAATETLILVEYTPEGPIRWIFSRDEEGALGVDLRFRKSF